MATTTSKADHLVVLIHGLWGNPSHLKYLQTQLAEKHGKDELHILVAKSTADSFTYDGIELGGERVTHEIEKEIATIESTGATITKLSIIGYSMDGLIARYAIGLLHADGLFDRITPVNFTTFATPHLGARAPVTGAASKFWNSIGAYTLSTSGRQLFLVDTFRDTGRPLLAVLADKNSVFIRALKKFEHRTLYANTINDRTVPYHTGSISRNDPFVDMAAVSLNALPETDGVLLDPSNPVRRKKPVKRTLAERARDGLVYTASSIPFYFFVTFLLPFGAVFFLSSAAVQSFRSAQRIKKHEDGKAGIEIGKYRKAPFIVDEIRSVADRVYRQAATVGGEEYLPTPPPEEGERWTLLENERGSGETLVGDGKGADIKVDEDGKEVEEKWPTLALTDDQFEMIENLDEVGFTKYRAHISAVRHTHAAIVVRIPWRPGFGQGRTVVKHWLDHFVL